MEHGVAIINGANRGLGKAVAEDLARLGTTVVLGCRAAERGEAALATIRQATGTTQMEVLPIDLADQQSVRAVKAAFGAQHDRLDVLINNAAVYKTERTLTRDGIETMFATNHLGLPGDEPAPPNADDVDTVTHRDDYHSFDHLVQFRRPPECRALERLARVWGIENVQFALYLTSVRDNSGLR